MGVRTVQRHERKLGLPVRRLAGKPTGPVMALQSELEDWVGRGTARQHVIRKSWPGMETNRLGAQFLQTDSEVALTFSGLALGRKKGSQQQKDAAKTARRAYDTITRLRENVHLTKKQNEKLDANLQRLRSELQSLGQSF
jgi:hypothetical protein